MRSQVKQIQNEKQPELGSGILQQDIRQSKDSQALQPNSNSQKVEDARSRAEKKKKVEEHKQRVQALEEA